MRKLICLLLSVLALASMAACSPGNAASPPNKVAPVALSAEEQAVIVDYGYEGSQVSLRLAFKGNGASYCSDELPFSLGLDPDAGLIRMVHGMSGAEGVSDDEEAIIYVASFTGGKVVHPGYNVQQLQEEPGSLAGYAYALVVKCRFSTNELLPPGGASS